MPTLPTALAFTGSGVTEGQFKTAITDQREFLAGLLGTAGTQAAALTALGSVLNGVLSKSAAYSVVAADRGKLIDCTTGTWTLTLTAAATLGNGFAFAIRNSGTGVITIDPNSAEQIDGASTIPLAAGESCLVVCDGTAWKTVGKTASGAVDVQTFTTAGAATWTKPARGSIAVIECWGGGGGGAASNNSMYGAGGGGGGGYNMRMVPLSALGATESVVVAAGGAGRSKTSNGSDGGNGGGNTSFGSLVTAYGGAGGNNSTNGGYSAGGGPRPAGSETVFTGSGYIALHSSQFRGEKPTSGIWWGGPGSANDPNSTASGGNGGDSVYGGGGGGAGYSSGTTGGVSTFGGNGGNGGDASPLPTSGAQPGGGGGGAVGSGIMSGSGAAGKCVVTVF